MSALGPAKVRILPSAAPLSESPPRADAGVPAVEFDEQSLDSGLHVTEARSGVQLVADLGVPMIRERSELLVRDDLPQRLDWHALGTGLFSEDAHHSLRIELVALVLEQEPDIEEIAGTVSPEERSQLLRDDLLEPVAGHDRRDVCCVVVGVKKRQARRA